MAFAAQIRKQRNYGVGLAFPALLLIVVFFILPVLALLLRSVTEPDIGLHHYYELFATRTYTRIFINTFLVAGLTTVITLVIGYPVAWLLAVMPSRIALFVFGIIILSMWTNLLARTYAWDGVVAKHGCYQQNIDAMGYN